MTRFALHRMPGVAILRAIGGDFRGRIGLAVVALLFLMALFPTLFAPFDPGVASIDERLSPPTSTHLLGTDHLGRDILSRLVYGTRYTVVPALIVVLASAVLGCTAGVLAGHFGGKVDWALMRLSDVALGFPLFIMAMAIIAVIGRGLMKALLAGVVVWWAQYARLMRASVLSVHDLPYVEVARTVGLTESAIVRKYVVPNALTPIIVKVTFDVARVLLLLTGLSFLGLGTLSPTPEWGVMITESRSYILQAWWYPTAPGLAIMISCLGFNLLGDALASAWDPRQRRA